MSIQETIQGKVQTALKPLHLDVANESSSHNVPANSETHFKLVAVSGEFEGKNLVKRHQLVYSLLSEELAGPVHALALHLFTPDEWDTRNQRTEASPDCLGGSKS